MKTTDGPTRYADKHDGKDRQGSSIRMRVPQPIPQLRKSRMMHIQHHQDTHRHEKQSHRKQRIHLTDNLINRQHRSQYIIQEHHHNPERRVQHLRSQLRQQTGRPRHKHSTHQNHQHHRKHTHHLLGTHTQITPDQLRQALTVMTHRQHPRQIIMHSPRKNTPQHNPQIRRSPELSPHDGPENRPQPGNVKELYHKNLPRRHRNIIHAIRPRQGRRLPVIRTEYTLHHTPINKITGNQCQQAKCKCNHGSYICLTRAKVVVSPIFAPINHSFYVTSPQNRQ